MVAGKKHLAAALLLGLVSCQVVHAQARYAGTGPGSLVSIGGTFSEFRLQYGQRTLGAYGAYIDLNPTWRYGVEGEARWLRYNQSSGTQLSTYLVGPKFALRARRINPYAKVLVGLGHFDFPYGYGYGNYFVIAPAAGVDVKLHGWRTLNQRVTVRLIEFQYQDWTSFTFGGLHPHGLSSGISFSLARSGTKMGD